MRRPKKKAELSIWEEDVEATIAMFKIGKAAVIVEITLKAERAELKKLLNVILKENNGTPVLSYQCIKTYGRENYTVNYIRTNNAFK